MQIDELTTVSVIMRGRIGQGHQLVVGLPDYSLDEAQKLFAAYDIHHLPVVESLEDPRLVGIVSSTDVLRFYFTPKPRGARDVRLGAMMTKDPVTIRPDTAIRDAVSQLAQAAFNSLPVVDTDGRLAGIVTTRDIVRYLNGQYAEDVYRHIQSVVAEATSRVPE